MDRALPGTRSPPIVRSVRSPRTSVLAMAGGFKAPSRDKTRRKYPVTDVGQCNGVTCGEQSRRQTVEYRVILDDYVEWGSWRCGQPNNDDPTAMLARVSRTTGATCHSR